MGRVGSGCRVLLSGSLAVAAALFSSPGVTAEPMAPKLLARIDLSAFAPAGAFQRGSVQFGDLDGDGRFTDFIRSQNGRRIQAFRWNGAEQPTLLWSFESPLVDAVPLPPDRYHYKLVVHDLDGDGKSEVVAPVPTASGKIALRVLDGMTGAIKAETLTTIDNPKSDHVINETRLRLTVADLSGKGRPTDLVLLTENDSFGDLFAFDAALKPLWNTTGDNGSKRRIYAHYPWHADLDGDGRQETIASTVFGHDGRSRFRMTPGFWAPADLFYDHLDRVIVADIDPARPGLELAMSYEFNKARVTDARGHELWSTPNLEGDSKLAAVGEFRTDSPGLELLVYDPAQKGKLLMLSATGKLLGSVDTPGGRFDGYVIDWDGDPATDESFQSAGAALLAPASGYGIEIGKLYLSDARTPTQPANRTYGAALDLTGDRREEIVVWDEDELLVYGASGPAAGAQMPSWWTFPAYRVAVANAMNDHHPERPHVDFRALHRGDAVAAAPPTFAPAAAGDGPEIPELNEAAGLSESERRAVTIRKGEAILRIGRPGEAVDARQGQVMLSPPRGARKFYTFRTGDVALMDFELRQGGKDAVIQHLTSLMARQNYSPGAEGALTFRNGEARLGFTIEEEERDQFRVLIDLKSWGG